MWLLEKQELTKTFVGEVRYSSIYPTKSYSHMIQIFNTRMNTDRKLFEFSVNNTRYCSEHRILTGAQIKEIAGVPSEESLFMVRPNGKEELITDHKTINFTRPGVEKFVSRKNAEDIMIRVNGPDTNPSGDRLPGESVKVQNMMNFTVSGTVVS